MWWVGISVSPCKDAAKMGYDDRQINRIVIRLAQYWLGRNMCVIFGHDWREDGVMRAIAEFAIKAAAGARRFEQTSENLDSGQNEDFEKLRMLNVVPTARNCLSRAAVDAQRESGGVLQLLTLNEAVERLNVRNAELASQYFQQNSEKQRAEELTKLRLCITALLDPGCRICLGGKTSGYEGKEPGIVEEARLALELDKPLYLLGGFGGATRRLGENNQFGCMQYWETDNGLSYKERRELFETTDIERSLRLISNGIEKLRGTV